MPLSPPWHCHQSPDNNSKPLQWRHNDHDGVSNHQPNGCLLNRLFRRRSKKPSKLRITGLCVGNSLGPVNSPRKRFPFDDVIMTYDLYFISLLLWRDNAFRITGTVMGTTTRSHLAKNNTALLRFLIWLYCVFFIVNLNKLLNQHLICSGLRHLNAHDTSLRKWSIVNCWYCYQSHRWDWQQQRNMCPNISLTAHFSAIHKLSSNTQDKLLKLLCCLINIALNVIRPWSDGVNNCCRDPITAQRVIR